MSPDELIVEARARIMWGDEPKLARAFLISEGMTKEQADAEIRELLLERNSAIRQVGIRDVLIGALLIGAAGGFFYMLFASPHIPRLSARSGKGYGVLALGGFYGLWRLMNGVFRLVRPKSEHQSLPEISE